MTHRITTRYSAEQDRLQVLLAQADGTVVSCWITRRLLLASLPALLRWAQHQSLQAGASPERPELQSTAWQAFEQSRAMSQREPVAAVPAPQGDAGWVVQEINVSASSEAISLRLRGSAEAQVALFGLDATSIRQWLHTLKAQEQQAGWGVVWPAWMAPETSAVRH